MPTNTLAATDFEVVIGLEVHSQLLTKSKMFCSCSTDYANAAPNTHVCPICMGMPGVLPVINQQAVAYTIMTALALNCSIPEYSKFDRKNYPYPDLMKGYQISQYDIPLSRNGYLSIEHNGQTRKIGITRVHLEEDTARLLHHGSYSLVDVNRSGTPLMEIVSEPDMRSPEEARLYMQKLREILVYLGVSSGRMEEGSLRCDANISIRPRGQEKLGVKTEIKNMNSFRSVERALEYEAQRQITMARAGEPIYQETRGWVETKGITVPQRSKEQAHDYRYFPEPDLLDLLDKERITGKQAKEVLDEAFASGEMPETIVEKKGIKPPISDQGELERLIEEVVASNTKVANDYRDGKTNALQFLVGQVMKRTRGQAKADIVQKLLRAKLDEAPSK